MDFGQQRQQNQQNAKAMMYQNTNYDFERRNNKTLIVDVADTSTTHHLTKTTEFAVSLFEPLIIDRLSDIYLDSFMTHNSLVSDTGDSMAFALKINEFNVNSNVSSTNSKQHIFNRIIIPNEHTSIADAHSCVVHKGKKLNYVCSINPTTLSKISGKISDLGGNSIYSKGGSNSVDGGVLHHVVLTVGVTKYIPSGSTFGFANGASSTGTTNFKTAYHMSEKATDLYFFSNGGSILTDGTGLTTINGGVTGLTGLTVDVSTYRAGDYPRFIAEFIIVARE